MSLVHGTTDPATRLCAAIFHWGGMTGEKITVPVKPAVFHAV